MPSSLVLGLQGSQDLLGVSWGCVWGGGGTIEMLHDDDEHATMNMS